MNLLEWLAARMKRPEETDRTLKEHQDALRRVKQLERERAEFEALEKPKK